MSSFRKNGGLVLIAGSLLYTLAFFMTLPLLGLTLARELGLRPRAIGALLAIAPLVSSLTSFAMGFLADRWSARRVCLVGSAGFAAAFMAYAVAWRPLEVAAVGVLLGLAKACWDPAFKSVLAAITPPERRPEVFRWRYLAFCVGAVAGPALGALLVGYGRGVLFGAAGALLALHTVWLVFALGRVVDLDGGERVAFAAGSLRLLARDRRLSSVVAAGVLVFTVFSLFDSILPLTLRPLTSAPEVRFVRLLVTSAAVSIALQIPLARWVGGVETGPLVAAGCGLFAAAFLAFAAGVHGVAFYFLGTVLFAGAEAVVYPNLDVLTERIAPSRMRATYFGTAELRYLGFVLGPLLGGWALDRMGHVFMFGAAALVSLAAMGIVVVHNNAVAASQPAPLELLA